MKCQRLALMRRDQDKTKSEVPISIETNMQQSVTAPPLQSPPDGFSFLPFFPCSYVGLTDHKNQRLHC